MAKAQKTTAALRVLIVDGNPDTLSDVSQFLVSAGYEVAQVGTGVQARAVIEAHPPHFLICGWNLPDMTGIDLCRMIRGAAATSYLYVFLLTQQSKACDLLSALQAGADDFLSVPIVHGEMLARLRAGARGLEHERRMAEHQMADPLTGLLGQRALYSQMTRRLSQARQQGNSLTCLTMDVDFLSGVNHAHGHRLGDDVLRSLGRLILRQSGDLELAGRSGDDEFCVLLSGATERAAREWAEKLRQAVASEKFVSRDQTIPITISIGIAECADTMPTAEAFLQLARSALRMSKEAGRNRCTYLHSGDAEAILLDRPAATCDVLNRTVARDVMAACIVLVEELETVGRAAEYLRRSRLLQAPVVNAAGECVGVVNTAELERIANQKDTANWPVRDVMNNDVIFQEESATLKSLFELFRRGSADEIVIVHDAKPTGMVTRGGLAMLSEPISEETFRATGVGCGSSADMIVPELEVLAES